MAVQLGSAGPMALVSSPLRRTRETADALAERWGTTAEVEPAVGELPSPRIDDRDRPAWLRQQLAARWIELDDELQVWRAGVLDALRAQPHDAVVVTHYVAINAAVGAAAGDDRVVSFSPGYCSITELESSNGRLRVVSLGDEAAARVG
jgi:broad specificity phosphatase PhoE